MPDLLHTTVGPSPARTFSDAIEKYGLFACAACQGVSTGGVRFVDLKQRGLVDKIHRVDAKLDALWFATVLDPRGGRRVHIEEYRRSIQIGMSPERAAEHASDRAYNSRSGRSYRRFAEGRGERLTARRRRLETRLRNLNGRVTPSVVLARDLQRDAVTD
jgi:hypothetical protein